MKIIRSKEFTADRAWGAMDVANMNGITTRVHWTDQPYKWHVNDGEEVFAVLDGKVCRRLTRHSEPYRGDPVRAKQVDSSSQGIL